MPSYAWIKLYIEVLDDPKMGRMSDRLWRRAIEMFMLAGEVGDQGQLPSIRDMAWTLRVDEDSLLIDLIELSKVNITQQVDGSWYVPYIARIWAEDRRISEWPALRRRILERDGWTCHYCGATASHVDHVMPRCQGGGDDENNLVAACEHCNASKNGRTPAEWAQNPMNGV